MTAVTLAGATLRSLAVLAWPLAPGTALACATCLDAAYGDRGFNWAFAGMMVAPLAVALALLGGLVWIARGRAGLEQPVSVRVSDRLETAMDAELAEDVLDVVPDRRPADV